MKEKKNNIMDKGLLKQFEEAYGKKKAKKIIKKIKLIKEKNPNIIFSFVFDENGNFQAIPKAQADEQ